MKVALGTIVRGAALTAQGQAQEGLSDIRQGLTACHTLGAKFLQPWGLAMLAESYARLWQQQGKPAAAYELLAPIYGWFTEGFDTADLQEAKALLQALT